MQRILIFLSIWFAFPSILFSGDTPPELIYINTFLPFNAPKQEALETSIQEKLKQELGKSGYRIETIKQDNTAALKSSKDNGAALLIGGYYEKDKNGRLNLYTQIYDAEKGELIDSVIITDLLAGTEGVELDKNEMKESELPFSLQVTTES